MEILSEVARGTLGDYIHCGLDGSYVDVGPESLNSHALQEVTTHTEYDKEGDTGAVVTKLKLRDPVSAIKELNQMDGAYPPKGEGDKPPVNVNINLVNLTDEQLAQIALDGQND